MSNWILAGQPDLKSVQFTKVKKWVNKPVCAVKKLVRVYHLVNGLSRMLIKATGKKPKNTIWERG